MLGKEVPLLLQILLWNQCPSLAWISKKEDIKHVRICFTCDFWSFLLYKLINIFYATGMCDQLLWSRKPKSFVNAEKLFAVSPSSHFRHFGSGGGKNQILRVRSSVVSCQLCSLTKEYILQGRAAVFASLLGIGKLVAVERKNDDAGRHVTVTWRDVIGDANKQLTYLLLRLTAVNLSFNFWESVTVNL